MVKGNEVSSKRLSDESETWVLKIHQVIGRELSFVGHKFLRGTLS